MNNRHTVIGTSLGDLTLVASGEALVGVYFPNHWPRPEVLLGERVEGDELLTQAAGEVLAYLAGERMSFDVPIRLLGDAFQRRVWGLLAEIPYGETTTYGELAERLGDKALARDVGQAVGRNPLCVVLPCHRVVGKGGKLTGYAGGLRRKQLLLELEEPVGARLF
ncbi:methylated-DNA--[protein]-cysteine S-methyltransferase [Kribbella sp. NPDC051770]|uniref:methylated-DNA--[protein]-cysteine S-methyltransferase n=1 Tax=Kribbella sp. NPDC051770 TaxID=3155413 RepID=UPI00341FA187